jgi:hypothetical protein
MLIARSTPTTVKIFVGGGRKTMLSLFFFRNLRLDYDQFQKSEYCTNSLDGRMLIRYPSK